MSDELTQPDAQAPEKPKKPKKDTDTKKYVMWGLIGGGFLIINTLLVVIVLRFVFPSQDSGENGEEKTKIEKPKDEFEGWDEEEADFFASEADKRLMKIEKIVTNPKSSSKYVVISFAMYYRPHPTLELEVGNPDSPLVAKLNAKVKSAIITEIASHSESELEGKRLEFNSMFKDRLAPVFKEYKLFLREVIITEFLIQG